ncbi:regulator of G protein signaling domain [Catovirus CTV1]|uniref:Regulator of G protein signaling domain n=1 Tax=Catovirus CTV1 TaxID=1977631 RepID=A0A1V0SA96_9VIRU|nr:regulator of G protein signaling domain [Catovirus CTV1]
MEYDCDLSGNLLEKKDTLFGHKYKKYFYVVKNNNFLKYKCFKGDLVESIDLSMLSDVRQGFFETKKTLTLIQVNGVAKVYYFIDSNEFDILFNKVNYVMQKNKGEKFIKEIEILESVGDACIITNDIFEIVGFNEKAEKLLGYRRNEIYAKNIKIFMFDYYSNYYQNVISTKKINEAINRKMFVKIKNGKKISVSMSIGEYISKTSLRKIYIHILRELGNPPEIENNTEDDRFKIFTIINQYSEELKTKITNYYSNDIKMRDSYEQRIRILEEENRNLLKCLSECNEKKRDLEDNLNFYKRKSCRTNLIQVLSNEYSFNCLLDFCKENKNEENILFWKALDKLKNKYITEPDHESLQLDVKEIYLTFIKKGAQYEINVAEKIKESILEDIENKKNLYYVFDPVVYEVVYNLNENIFPLFLDTPNGRKIMSLLNQ